MNRLPINFARTQSPWRLPAKGKPALFFGFVLVTLAFILGGSWLWQEYRYLTEIKAQLAQEKFRLGAQQPAVMAQPKRVNNAADIDTMNSAIRRLNTPWPYIFSGFESVASPKVALLSIAPDAKVALLRGTAEARTHEAMIDYVQRLSETEPFVYAVLVKHEINDRDPQRPLHFSFEVRLQAPKKEAR